MIGYMGYIANSIPLLKRNPDKENRGKWLSCIKTYHFLRKVFLKPSSIGLYIRAIIGVRDHSWKSVKLMKDQPPFERRLMILSWMSNLDTSTKHQDYAGWLLQESMVYPMGFPIITTKSNINAPYKCSIRKWANVGWANVPHQDEQNSP